MHKFKDYEIKLIVDALHRDAQRCDNLIEQYISSNKEININFYTDKSNKLREIANNLTVSKNNKNIVINSELVFDPNIVKVITPNSTTNKVINALPPPNKELTGKTVASKKKNK